MELILIIEVSCREDAGGLSAKIPYGIVALEVKDGIDVEVYQEVKDRVRTKIRP